LTARAWMVCTAFAVLGTSVDIGAVVQSLTQSDLERAVALARWPRTDADRSRFHKRYVFEMNEPAIDYWTVTRIEVVTAFRRVELMAESHTSDLWGRGGVADVERDIQPWRDRVSIVAHLALRSDRPYIGGVPDVDVVVDGPDRPAPIELRRTEQLAYCGGKLKGCPVIGGTVEAVFAARSIGQVARSITAAWNGRALARVSVDFGQLD